MSEEATFWRMEAERHAVLPSPSDHAEMPKRVVGRRMVRTCSCGKPWPCDQARWNRLREHITQERAAQDQLAGDHEESGHGWQTERAYGRVEALDRLLAVMDELEAGR